MSNRTTHAAAHILGVSKSKVDKLIYSGELRSFKLAGRRVTDDAAIGEYEERCKQQSGYYKSAKRA